MFYAFSVTYIETRKLLNEILSSRQFSYPGLKHSQNELMSRGWIQMEVIKLRFFSCCSIQSVIFLFLWSAEEIQNQKMFLCLEQWVAISLIKSRCFCYSVFTTTCTYLMLTSRICFLSLTIMCCDMLQTCNVCILCHWWNMKWRKCARKSWQIVYMIFFLLLSCKSLLLT